MLDASDKEAIDKGMILPRIIWAAMLISLFIYVLICHLAENQIRQNIQSAMPLNLLKNILYIVAIIELFISYFLRKLLLTSNLINLPTNLNSSQPSTQSPYIARYTIAMIIALAISESIGIYGLVLFFLGDYFQTLYTFIGLAAIAMIYYRPKKEEIETLANEMKRKALQSPSP